MAAANSNTDTNYNWRSSVNTPRKTRERENILLQGLLSVLTLISVFVPPPRRSWTLCGLKWNDTVNCCMVVWCSQKVRREKEKKKKKKRREREREREREGRCLTVLVCFYTVMPVTILVCYHTNVRVTIATCCYTIMRVTIVTCYCTIMCVTSLACLHIAMRIPASL